MNARAGTLTLSSSSRRIAAMVLRYWYLLRSSFARLAELIYWPTVQMLMWGFLQTYLAGQTNLYARAGGVLIGADVAARLDGRPVFVLADPALGALYVAAVATLGGRATVIDSQPAFVAGITRIRELAA